MNNEQLFELFQKIDESTNCFDRAIALKQAKKQYRKSDFYKQTLMPIHKAYEMYQIRGVLDLCALLNTPTVRTFISGDTLLMRLKVQNFFAEFDTSVLEPIFEYVLEKLNDVATISGEDIIELKNVVGSFLTSIGK